MTGKRGHQTPKQLRRPAPTLAPKKTVLIVCEGAKTEVCYFRALIRAKGRAMRSVQVVCVGGNTCGTHPKSIVDYAVGKREGYSDIWCVFDRDEHADIQGALFRAHSRKFSVALSNPCFELWFLLHFVYTTSPMSRGEALGRLLEDSCIPDYSKGLDVYALLAPKMTQAVIHAERLRAYHGIEAASVDCVPCTDADKLVEFLDSLVY